MVKDFSNDTSLLNISQGDLLSTRFTKPPFSMLIFGITTSRYVESLLLKGKLFPFLTSSNSILSHEIELNFGTFFLRCLELYMRYLGISFDAKRTVKLDQPSFARCMFLLFKRNLSIA